jgi:dipeptidyl-peptidase-3
MESYDSYIRNGLTQLVCLELGADIEKSQMRNRQWLVLAFEKGKKDNVIEKISRDGKIF